MRRRMDRRGVYFTLMSVFVIVVVLAVVATRVSTRYRDRSDAVSSRIKSMNLFVDDLDKDLQREMYIGGYRSLISLSSYLREKEGFIDNLDAAVTEVFINGTINGTSILVMQQGGAGADLNSWLSRMNEEASKMGIIVSFHANDISLRQIDPWDIELEANLSLMLDDSKGVASYNITNVYVREFSIIGLEDPLYTVETSDKVTNLINITPSTVFVGASNDTSVLNTHILESYYTNSTDAPSYLMRFEGNLSPSPYGIESMVNLEKFDSQNIPLFDRSIVDHVYFDNTSTTNYCNVTGLPSWFRIDESHLDFYMVEDLVKSCS